MASSAHILGVLKRYSDGDLGTRATLEQADLRDYADLIIALAQNDLALPRPRSTPARDANIARARAILQPLLRHGD